MKKILSSCFAIVAIALTNQINAQQVIDISGGVNITKSYSTAATNSSNISEFNWSVPDGGAVSFSNGQLNTQSVTWDASATPGTYRLQMTPRSNNNCDGETKTLNVQLVTSLPVTVAWASNALSTCPFITGVTGNEGDIIATLNITGTVPSGTWRAYYKIDSGTETYVDLTGASANFFIDSNYANASSTADATYTIAVTRFVVNGTEYTPSSTVNLTYTVYPTPTANDITF